jgi:hypothetical protein
MITRKMETIEIAKIQANKVQPSGRTKDVETLAASIRTHGLFVPVAVVATREGYVLADGHRRVAALRALDRDTVRAEVYRGVDPESLFAALNAATMPIRSKSWFEAWARSSDPDAFLHEIGRSSREQIRSLVGYLGLEQTRRLGIQGYTASYVCEANTAHMMAARLGVDTKGVTTQDAVRWIFDTDISQHRTRARWLRSLRMNPISTTDDKRRVRETFAKIRAGENVQ